MSGNLVENEVMWATRADEVEPENADEVRPKHSEPMALCSKRSLGGLVLWSFRAQDGACFKDNAFEDGEATSSWILMEL